MTDKQKIVFRSKLAAYIQDTASHRDTTEIMKGLLDLEQTVDDIINVEVSRLMGKEVLKNNAILRKMQ